MVGHHGDIKTTILTHFEYEISTRQFRGKRTKHDLGHVRARQTFVSPVCRDEDGEVLRGGRSQRNSRLATPVTTWSGLIVSMLDL